MPLISAIILQNSPMTYGESVKELPETVKNYAIYGLTQIISPIEDIIFLRLGKFAYFCKLQGFCYYQQDRKQSQLEEIVSSSIDLTGLPSRGVEPFLLSFLHSGFIIARIVLYFILGPEFTILDLVFVQSLKLIYLINALIAPY
jgi:hypothetical protein